MGLIVSQTRWTHWLPFSAIFYSGRPADDEHPYGHERMEAIGGFLVVIIMAYLGIDLLRRSIMLVFNPSEIEVSPLIIAIMVMAILLKIGLTIFYHFQNKKLKSGLLQANAMDAFLISSCRWLYS